MKVVTKEEEQKKKEYQQKPLKVIEGVCSLLGRGSLWKKDVIVVQGVHEDKPNFEDDPQCEEDLVRFAECQYHCILFLSNMIF